MVAQNRKFGIFLSDQLVDSDRKYRLTLETSDECLKSRIVDLKKLKNSFVDYFRCPSKSTDKQPKYRIEYLKKKKVILWIKSIDS